MSELARPASSRRVDVAIAVALWLCTSLVLQLASRREGFARDEGYYFHAAEQHAAYYEELGTRLGRRDWKALRDRGLIDRYFSYNNEHPPLMKTLFGLSWRVLHRCSCPTEAGLHPLSYPKRDLTLGLLRAGVAIRLPAHLLAGALVAAVYLIGRRAFGRAGALAAAGLAILAPRHFFHAELSCFDAPVTAMLGVTTWAYLRAQQTSRTRFAVLAGVLFGLSLSTKHNAFFLPPLLLLHALWLRRDLLTSHPAAPQSSKLRRILRYLFQPWALAMALLGPLTYLDAFLIASFAPSIADRDLLAAWLAFWGLVRSDAGAAGIHSETYAAYRARIERLLSDLAAARGTKVDARAGALGQRQGAHHRGRIVRRQRGTDDDLCQRRAADGAAALHGGAPRRKPCLRPGGAPRKRRPRHRPQHTV